MDSIDEISAVRHVLNNRQNYYRLLFLNRSATTEQIKAAYKKMVVKCHPDKNKHPNAAEAFTLVQLAHETLSDSTKRHVYDTYGAAGAQRHEQTTAQQGARNASAYFYAQRRPHEFFEGFVPRQGAGIHVQEIDLSANILMLLPLFLFLLMAIFLQSSLTDFTDHRDHRRAAGGRSDDGAHPFSLTPDPALGHVVERVTSLNDLRVKYYVNSLWAERAARGAVDVRRVERDVLRRQRESLARRCEAESLLHKARGVRETPRVCVDYDEFRRALR